MHLIFFKKCMFQPFQNHIEDPEKEEYININKEKTGFVYIVSEMETDHDE